MASCTTLHSMLGNRKAVRPQKLANGSPWYCASSRNVHGFCSALLSNCRVGVVTLLWASVDSPRFASSCGECLGGVAAGGMKTPAG